MITFVLLLVAIFSVIMNAIFRIWYSVGGPLDIFMTIVCFVVFMRGMVELYKEPQ